MRRLKKISKKALMGILIIATLSYTLNLLSPGIAKAATTYEWQGDKIIKNNDDASTSGSTDEFFNQGKHDGSLYSFSTLDKIDGDPPRCESHIDFIIGEGPSKAIYYEGYIPTVNNPSDRKCAYREGVKIDINNANAGDKKLNEGLGLKECPGGPGGKAPNDANYNCLGGGAVINGDYKRNGTVNQKDPTTETDTGTGDEAEADTACWKSIPVFGWMLCPILDFANYMYDLVFSMVRNLLFIPEASYNSSDDLKTAWTNMRNIASAAIVLVALAIIAAQIFNFEFVSAYTVKKALPRLVIAAILIQLSWYIFTLLIQISNGVGAGVYTLLTMPFDAGDILRDIENQNSVVGSGSQNFGGLLLFLGLAGGIAVTALTPATWITLVLVSIGVIISLLVALLTLILRKMLIITLLVLAPIALAAWILPGTSKFWNMWWQLFSKLLIMFPLIMILFAAGQIFASTIAKTDDGGITAGVTMIMMIVAFFAPLFLIPATFKTAGGIFSQIVGWMDGSGKKISGGGFGLKRRRDAYKKLSDEIKAQETNAKARRTGAKTLNPNSNPWQRARGRAIVGGWALLPGTKRGNEALRKYQNIYGSTADKMDMEDAGGIWTGAMQYASFDQRKDAQIALANATDGQEITVSANDRNGIKRTIKMQTTPFLQRHGLMSATNDKNIAAIDTFMSETNPDGSTRSKEEMSRRQAIFDTFSEKDGGFGNLDKQAPDKTRGGTIAKQLPHAIRYINTLKGDPVPDPVTGESLGFNVRQKAVYDELHRQLTSSSQVERENAVTAINQFSRRADLGDIDAPVVRLIGSLAGGEAKKIIDSGGNLRMEIDPKTGKTIIVESHEI